MSNAGRKPKYTTDLLFDKLTDYVNTYPNKIIKYSALEKFSGIPYHIWRDNSELKSSIDKVNNPEVILNTKNMTLELPSTDDIMLHYNNKKNLSQSISDILNFTISLYEKALKGEQFEEIETKYKIQINEMKASYENKLKEANDEIEKLNKEIDNLYLDGRNSLIRKQTGLRANMIEISKYKENEISKNIKDIEAEFSGLFD